MATRSNKKGATEKSTEGNKDEDKMNRTDVPPLIPIPTKKRRVERSQPRIILPKVYVEPEKNYVYEESSNTVTGKPLVIIKREHEDLRVKLPIVNTFMKSKSKPIIQHPEFPEDIAEKRKKLREPHVQLVCKDYPVWAIDFHKRNLTRKSVKGPKNIEFKFVKFVLADEFRNELIKKFATTPMPNWREIGINPKIILCSNGDEKQFIDTAKKAFRLCLQRDALGNIELHRSVTWDKPEDILRCAIYLRAMTNSLDITNFFGFTPLQLAIIVNRKEPKVYENLLKLGSKITQVHRVTGNNLLHLAILFENHIAIKFLLRRSELIINTVNAKGFTPLQYAIVLKNTWAARMLVNYSIISGLNINEQDWTYGRTALYLAVEYELEDIAALILEKGGDISILNHYGTSVITLGTIVPVGYDNYVYQLANKIVNLYKADKISHLSYLMG